MKTPKRPRDPNQLAKFIVDIAGSEACESPATEKDPAAVERGRAGGLKGGQARAAATPAHKRSEIAKKAAKARWGQE